MMFPAAANSPTIDLSPRFQASWLMSLLLLLVCVLVAPAVAQTAQGGGTAEASEAGANVGPIRLRQPAQAEAPGTAASSPARRPDETNRTDRTGEPATAALPQARPRLSEFEEYVRKLAASADPQRVPPPNLRRFGSDFLNAVESSATPSEGGLVPPDYVMQTGDEIVLTLWGSVDADLRLVIDRSGRVTIPRVGPVMLAGVRYGDLGDNIARRVAQVFRNFHLSVSLGQLRGLRVFVTGFVERPGPVTVSGLSTISSALLRAGGPSVAGSLRNIELRRGREVVTAFDFYDLLLRGDRSNDRPLQANDVIHVGPLGTQVAAIGSVNRPAIFEFKPGETLGDLMQMAGGFSTVADTSRVTIERLDDREGVRIAQLAMPGSTGSPLRSGDVVRAFNAVAVALPVQRQNKRVRVEGEVLRPGEYVMPPQSTLSDALQAAGGLTAAAYVFGAEFNRESVRVTQQQNYERALRDLETELTRSNSTQRTTTADEAAAQASREASANRLVERLRTVKPTGRVVLQLSPGTSEFPALALEDGDRLYVPPRPTTVGVFGSVFNAGSYLYAESRRLDDYLRLAGGPTRGADSGSIFAVRANGSVVSSLQRGGGGWFGNRNAAADVLVEPGDTIFVPEEVNKSTFVQNLKDWTQVIYQFGLGVAGVKALGIF